MKNLLTTIILVSIFITANAQDFAPESTNAGGGTLTVTTNTSSAGGQYANKNCLAFWIQNSAGTIVNTMMYYTGNGDSSCADLSVWNGKIGGWANRNALKNVDGISGATLSSHAARSCYWGKTVSLTAIPDGTYTVCLELNDGGLVGVNTNGHKYTTYTFVKGATNSTGVLSGTAQSCFSNVSIQWVAAATTAVQDVKLSTIYSIYPNPSKESVYVSGPDIKSVDIYTLNGVQVLFSKEKHLNINALPKGTYLLNIATGKGLVTKKLVKN